MFCKHILYTIFKRFSAICNNIVNFNQTINSCLFIPQSLLLNLCNKHLMNGKYDKTNLTIYTEAC